MNENWPEIVETLIPYFETNSVEGDYQREIENCLKFLGWKKTNGTMVSQYTLPIGNRTPYARTLYFGERTNMIHNPPYSQLK